MRTDMNHADEIYSFNLKKKTFKQLTKTNDEMYSKLALPKYERRYVTTTDNKKMLVWVILPPNFDKSKKHPTLLYCQGGPQSPLTQFYSFRWVFSNGTRIYCLAQTVAECTVTDKRANKFQDWGGQVMDIIFLL